MMSTMTMPIMMAISKLTMPTMMTMAMATNTMLLRSGRNRIFYCTSHALQSPSSKGHHHCNHHHGLAWHGMAWHGLTWHGMAWHGMATAMAMSTAFARAMATAMAMVRTNNQTKLRRWQTEAMNKSFQAEQQTQCLVCILCLRSMIRDLRALGPIPCAAEQQSTQLMAPGPIPLYKWSATHT